MLNRIALFALLALFAPLVTAAAGPIINGEGTATLTWDPPTHHIDGTPIAAPGVGGYVIFWDTASRFGRCAGAGATDPGPAMALDADDRPASKTDTSCYANRLEVTPGSLDTQALTLPLNASTTLYFTVIAYLGAGTASNDISPYSNQVAKQFTLTTQAPPLPPVLNSVDVTITCTTTDPAVTCSFTVQ